MVRLKVEWLDDAGEGMKLFQFQNGAIKSLHSHVDLQALLHFNSKMVRLKVQIFSQLIECDIHFNSKMVRLKANLHEQLTRDI